VEASKREAVSDGRSWKPPEEVCRRWGHRLPHSDSTSHIQFPTFTRSFSYRRRLDILLQILMPQSDSTPHSRNLRLHRQMEGPGTFFVSKCLEPRLQLIDESISSEICSAFCFYVEKKRIYLGAFVIVLDHWHVLLATADGKSICQRMDLGRWLGRNCGDILSRQGCDWQDGFHETRIRSARQFQFVCGYVEENPVRTRLVQSPSDWKWSTAHPSYQDYVTRPWPWRFERD
jgi:putative transposase